MFLKLFFIQEEERHSRDITSEVSFNEWFSWNREEQLVSISTSQDLSLFIETFNCGEKYLTTIDLQTNVPLNKDIYIFSLQECLHPTKSIKAIQQYLNTNHDYLIQSQSIGCNWKILGYHGTITIIVAVKKTVVEAFNPSTQNTVYEGFNLGCCRLGNKGGAAISLRFPSYSLLVVACHFSSDLKVFPSIEFFESIGAISSR